MLGQVKSLIYVVDTLENKLKDIHLLTQSEETPIKGISWEHTTAFAVPLCTWVEMAENYGLKMKALFRKFNFPGIHSKSQSRLMLALCFRGNFQGASQKSQQSPFSLDLLLLRYESCGFQVPGVVLLCSVQLRQTQLLDWSTQKSVNLIL